MTSWRLLTGRKPPAILVALVGLALVANSCVLPAAPGWDPVAANDGLASDTARHDDGSRAAVRCNAATAKAAPSCPHARDLLVALPTDRELAGGKEPRSDQAVSPVVAPRRMSGRSLFLLNAASLI